MGVDEPEALHGQLGRIRVVVAIVEGQDACHAFAWMDKSRDIGYNERMDGKGLFLFWFLKKRKENLSTKPTIKGD